MPSQLVADSARVYVLDPGGPRVVAFGAGDGSVAWTFERRGAGPGELRSPTSIARSGAGELFVLDEANQRITVIGADGRYARSIPLRAGFGFESLCARGAGEVLLKRSGHRGGLVRLAGDGSPVGEVDLPWPAGDAAWSAQWHGRLAGSGDACVLALSLGLGFAVHDAAGLRAPIAYVERFALPDVEVTQRRQGAQLTVSQRIVGDRSAAVDAAVADGRLHVVFGGESSLAFRVIDVYRLPGGAYERSYSYSEGIERIAVAGDMLYALVREGDVPRLVAFRTAAPGVDAERPEPATVSGR
jgi:outer membrane protein assembly factor BamB